MDHDLHPFVDEMYSFVGTVANGNCSTADCSCPSDGALFAVTADLSRSDQANAHKLQIAARRRHSFCAVLSGV